MRTSLGDATVAANPRRGCILHSLTQYMETIPSLRSMRPRLTNIGTDTALKVLPEIAFKRYFVCMISHNNSRKSSRRLIVCCVIMLCKRIACVLAEHRSELILEDSIRY